MACATSIKDAVSVSNKPHRKCYIVVGKGDYKSHVRITKQQAAWLLGRGILTDKPAFAYSITDNDELHITENMSAVDQAKELMAHCDMTKMSWAQRAALMRNALKLS